MGTQKPSESPTSPLSAPTPQLREVSRNALAKHLGVPVNKLPADKEAYNIINDDLKALKAKVDSADPSDQEKVIADTLREIRAKELASKAREVAGDLKKKSSELSDAAILQATELMNSGLETKFQGAIEGGLTTFADAARTGDPLTALKALDTQGSDMMSTVTGAIKGILKLPAIAGGGLISAFAWLLDLFGFDTTWLKGDEEKKDEKKEEKVENPANVKMGELEKQQMYAATWRHMLRLNTTGVKMVDPSKRAEFDTLLDTYMGESGIADSDIAGKKAFLEKIQKNFSDKVSLSKLLGLSTDIKGIKDTTPGAAASFQATKNFVAGMREKGVVHVEKIFSEQVLNATTEYMEKQGWITPDNKADKMDKLRARFAGEKYKKILADTELAITQNTEISMGKYAVGLMMHTPGMMWDLLIDIIPLTALTVYAVDNGFRFALRGYTALTTKGFDTALSVLSGEMLDENMKIPEDKRRIAITMLYQQGHLTTALAGMAARAMTTAMLFPLYYTQGTNISSAFMTGNQLLGRYDKMAANLHNLTRDILTNEQYKNFTEFDTHQRSSLIRVEAKLHIVDIFNSEPQLTQKQVYEKVAERMGGHVGENAKLTESIIEGFKNVPGSDANKPLTRELLHKEIFGKVVPGTRFPEWIRTTMSSVIGQESQPAIEMATNRIESNIGQVCIDATAEDKGGIDKLSKWTKKLVSVTGGTFAEFVENQNKGQIFLNVHAGTAEADIKKAKNVIKEMPAGVQHLFSGLTLLLVTDLALSAEEGKKTETLLSGLLAAHPFGAVYVFFTDGTKMKDHQFTHPAYLASLGIAGAFAGVEVASILMNARREGLGTALGKSITGPYKVVTSLPRGITNVVRGTQSINKASIAQAMKGSKREIAQALIIMAGTLTIGAAFSWWDTKKQKEYTDGLANRMLLNTDGSVNWKGVQAEMHAYTVDTKEQALKLAAATYFGDNTNNVLIKGNTVDILIQPSADVSRHMPYGIVDSSEIATAEALYKQLGYTMTLSYTTDSDSVIANQASKLRAEGYTQEQLDTLSRQIRWTSGAGKKPTPISTSTPLSDTKPTHPEPEFSNAL